MATLRDSDDLDIIPGHPDTDVQALIDGKIEISEYRQRKEKGDAV